MPENARCSRVMRVLAAIGGNAFVAPGAALTVEGEFRFAREALVCLEPFFTRGVELVITHGNGPQVGHQLGRAERSRETAYALPLDVCVAQTQGELGYVLAQTLHEILARRDIERPVAALVTQVEIDEGDEAFQRPSKPVGPFLDAKGAEALQLRGLAMQEDAARGYRRVVPSPEPRRVMEADAIQLLLAAGVTVVACGGGGVPVVPADRGHRGVEAVVDKDLTSALLADVIGAELLVLLTDVPYAYTGFRCVRHGGTPRRVHPRHARFHVRWQSSSCGCRDGRARRRGGGRLPERAARLGALALARLRDGLAGAAHVKEVRGRGLMLAVQFQRDIARPVAEALAREAAVLCKDTRGHTIRFLPPLVTPEDVLLDAVERMLPVLARSSCQ